MLCAVREGASLGMYQLKDLKHIEISGYNIDFKLISFELRQYPSFGQSSQKIFPIQTFSYIWYFQTTECKEWTKIFYENYEKPCLWRGERFLSSMWESYSHRMIFYIFVNEHQLRLLVKLPFLSLCPKRLILQSAYPLTGTFSLIFLWYWGFESTKLGAPTAGSPFQTYVFLLYFFKSPLI